MKFTSVNELDSFEFHDAQITNMKLVGSTMVWEMSCPYVTTENSQNDHPADMRIESAVLTFENIVINQLEFSAYKLYTADRELIESVDRAVAQEEDYADILAESLSSYCYTYGMSDFLKIDENKYQTCFNVDGGAGDYYLTFTFSKATVEWDVYDKTYCESNNEES